MRTEAGWLISRNFPGIYQEGPRKTTKYLIHDNVPEYIKELYLMS
jgi:hypothetical protein